MFLVLFFKLLNVFLIILFHFSKFLLIHLIHLYFLLLKPQIIGVFNKDLLVIQSLQFFNSFQMIHFHFLNVLRVFMFLGCLLLHESFVSLLKISFLFFITCLSIFKLFGKSILNFSDR